MTRLRTAATVFGEKPDCRSPTDQYARRRLRALCLAAFLVISAALAAGPIRLLPTCLIGCRPSQAGITAAAPSAAPAVIMITPPSGSRNVDPLDHVSVKVDDGTLTTVQMVNDAAKPIDGVMTPDNTFWKPLAPLGYGRTYTLTVTSRGSSGTPSTQTSTFSTLKPANQTKVSLAATSGAALQDQGTYGVGTVIVAHFDEPITDRATAEQRLVVTTSPPVQGSWYWVDDQNVHWRPEHYYAPGTTVTAKAQVYGVRVADGLYGQEDSQVTFRIGDAHISIADDATKQVGVYNNGKLVRTMPTSMGMGGTQTIGARTLSFWTPPGIYTVIGKAPSVIMDSSTFGLPINSRLGYRVAIHNATQISTDGIYLHQLDETVWAQGNTNTSHGCLNLNASNAKWFMDFSQTGDVVEVRNTGGPPLQLAQNGDWTLPWEQWRKGSALS